MESAGQSELLLPEKELLLPTSPGSHRMSSQTRSHTVSKPSHVLEYFKQIKHEFKKVSQLDITVLCSICEQSVHLTRLFHHKKAHKAQATLDYQHPWAETISIRKIAVRRQKLISNMIKTSKYTERAREKIGCSLEFLKESLKSAPYFRLDSIVESSVQSREVSTPLIKAIAICQDKNTLWCSELQDVFFVLDNYGNKPGSCFLGLFDGSNGVSAAETTSAELPILFLDQLSNGDNSYQVSKEERQVLDSFHTVFRTDYKIRERLFTERRTALKDNTKTSKPPCQYEWIHKAYAKSFWRMDRLLRLGRNEVSRVCWSSCTAVTCLVETLSNVKQQQKDQEVEETLGNESEQVIEHENLQPERVRIRIGTVQRNTDEPRTALLLSRQKTEGIKSEEELKTIEEEELSGLEEELLSGLEEEDKELPPTHKDSMREQDLLENEPSIAQPDESSLGVMNITKNIEEQGLFPLISDQKTESFRSDEEEDELKRIKEGDMGVLEEEEALPLSNKDSFRKTDLLENQPSTAQSEESGFGEMDITKNMEEKGLSSLLSDQKTESFRSDEEDELKRIKEEDTGVSEEEEEFPLSNKDSFRKTDPLENKYSTVQPDENGCGVMDIENNIEGMAPLLNNLETEDMKTEEDDEEMRTETATTVTEDTAIQSSKEKILLENIQSTAQPDESSFGVMHVANIGNVHALLCKNGKSYWVTKEHTTSSKEEKNRVLGKDGYISSNEPTGLVEGLVRTTRGLGHHGNPSLKKTIIPVPHTMSFPVDSSCQFLILASNGLWEVLDKSEVSTLTLIMFSAYLKKYQLTRQEKKWITPKCSKSTVDEMGADFISWYFNPEIFFTDNNQNEIENHQNSTERDENQNNAERDEHQNNAESNENQNNANLGPNDSEEEASYSEEEEQSEAEKSEDAAEMKRPSEDIFSTNTEESSSKDWDESSSEEGSKESRESIEEKVSESSSASFSEISEDEEGYPKTFYSHAAKYISKHLVQAALKAGSRDNITVLVALLNGCDKIPTYI